MSERAKIFQNGGSQAVRLPKEYRFHTDEVSVRRVGRGVLLEPLESADWPRGYWRHLPCVGDFEWTRPSDPPPAPIEKERDTP